MPNYWKPYSGFSFWYTKSQISTEHTKHIWLFRRKIAFSAKFDKKTISVYNNTWSYVIRVLTYVCMSFLATILELLCRAVLFLFLTSMFEKPIKKHWPSAERLSSFWLLCFYFTKKPSQKKQEILNFFM
jgi:hypothetical protein